MNIAGRNIGPGFSTFVVAEIGINHNGSIELAERMILEAAKAGADAVKFQKRTLALCYSDEELGRPRESPFGSTNRALKEALELGETDYERIDALCKKLGVHWFASAWDSESADLLDRLGVPALKVPSACLTDREMLGDIATRGKPVILSTGMSTQREVERAVQSLSRLDVALLACTAAYPANPADLHLSRIGELQRLFPETVVGYSGHEVGIWTTLCAVAMGASIIERHFTLDRSMWGSDQAASIEPHALSKLCAEIRTFEAARGEPTLDRLSCELPAWEKLRRWK